MVNSTPVLRATMGFWCASLLSACGGGGGDAGTTTINPVDSPSGWSIPVDEIRDGGPGKDGIPAIDSPVLINVTNSTEVLDSGLVIGVMVDGEYRAYPHDVMDYHEVANDSHQFDAFVVSYCPLTGSALAWDIDDGDSNTEFGVSGLLYNSNLIMYDRLTDSNWSQMLQQSVEGSRRGEAPVPMQVIETTFETWKAMYPDSRVMTRSTGHERVYDIYPYGNYRFDERLLFPVDNLDNRLHTKERVIGIHSDSGSKVYQIDGFGPLTQVVNDQFEDQSIVVVGDSEQDFAAIYSRAMSDGTLLTFTALQDQLPVVMQDDEGNSWDIFGTAVSGPRTGEQLGMTRSYTAFWFAWAAFFESAEIYF